MLQLRLHVCAYAWHCMQDAKQDALAFHSQLAAMRASEMEVSAKLSTELRYTPLSYLKSAVYTCKRDSELAYYRGCANIHTRID